MVLACEVVTSPSVVRVRFEHRMKITVLFDFIIIYKTVQVASEHLNEHGLRPMRSGSQINDVWRNISQQSSVGITNSIDSAYNNTTISTIPSTQFLNETPSRILLTHLARTGL